MYTVLGVLGNFVKLLLSTSQDQVKAIFNTLTPLQTAVISEIIFNIGRLPVTSKVIKLLGRHKFLFRKLSDPSLPIQRKVKIIRRHYKEVRDLLNAIKADLLNIVD